MAEQELSAVSEERDQLLPQLEEARWRTRQAEKDLAALRDASASLQQVPTWPTQHVCDIPTLESMCLRHEQEMLISIALSNLSAGPT